MKKETDRVGLAAIMAAFEMLIEENSVKRQKKHEKLRGIH